MPPLNVLLIKDSPDDTHVIELQVQKHFPGSVCRVVEGQESLRTALEEENWDMVLAYFRLSRLEGREALALVKERRPDLPLIIVSGASGKETAVNAMQAGAHDFIPTSDLSRIPATFSRELEAAVRWRRSHKAVEGLSLPEENVRNKERAQAAPISAIAMTDANGLFLYVNNAFLKLLGYDRAAELLGRPVTGFLEFPRMVEEVAGIIASQGFWRGKLKARRKDGATLDIEFSANAAFDRDGRLSQLTLVEITTKKWYEDSLLRELEINVALTQLYSPLVVPGSGLEQIAREVLRQTRSLTASELGFVSAVDPSTGMDNAYTLTDTFPIECSADGKNRFPPAMIDPGGVYRALVDSLGGSRKSFFNNNPAPHMFVQDAPDNHNTPLHRLLSVPVMLGKNRVGLIALANPARDYSGDDLEVIERIAGYYALAIQKNRTEKTLAYYTGLLEENMNQAREYQSRLVTFPAQASGRVQIGNGYYPSEQVGGDIINAVIIGPRLVFYSADISGHGVPAAILSTYIKACLDNWIPLRRRLSPGRLVNRLTGLLRGHRIFENNLLTIFVGVYHIRTRRLRYANAGHLRPFFADRRNPAVRSLSRFSPAIADLYVRPRAGEFSLRLPPDARLLVFSDGLIERLGSDGEFLGREGLCRVLNADFSTAAIESFLFFDLASSYRKSYPSAPGGLSAVERDFMTFVQGRYRERTVVRACHCLMECASNAAEYGNGYDPAKTVTVRVRCRTRRLEFSVQDEGKDFSRTSRPPVIPPAYPLERGRGLFLIKKFAKTFKVDRLRKRVICTFVDKARSFTGKPPAKGKIDVVPDHGTIK
jgi:PAS domain S-box-containing protein